MLSLGYIPPVLSLVLPKVRDSPFEPLPPLVAGPPGAGSSSVPGFRSRPGWRAAQGPGTQGNEGRGRQGPPSQPEIP